MTSFEALAEIMANPAASDMARVRACEAILERGWGRPSDETLLDAAATVSELGPIRFEFIMGEPLEPELSAYALDGDGPLELPTAAKAPRSTLHPPGPSTRALSETYSSAGAATPHRRDLWHARLSIMRSTGYPEGSK